MACRRLQQQLRFAEKREVLAREAVVNCWDPASRPSFRKVAKFWAEELERLQRRLVELLAGTGEGTADHPADR